jgi:drug/metabolite transporter (DMT)-like permease
VLSNPYLPLAFASLCWSGNHIAGRFAASDIPPFFLATARWVIPALLIWPFAKPHLVRDWPVVKTHWPILLFLSAAGGALFSALQYVGLRYTTAINVSVLNSLVPVLIVLVAGVTYRDRIAPLQGLGIATSLLGVLVIIAKLDWQTIATLSFNTGDLIILFNMLAWAVYSVYLRARPPIHWLSFTALLAILSSTMTAPLAIGELFAGATITPSLSTALTIAYVAIFPSVVATVCWNHGVALIGANRAGPFAHLVPLYSTILATLILGEALMLYHAIGFVLILAGVYLAAKTSAVRAS